MAKAPSKRSSRDRIADSQKLQDQSRNEQQKSYLLAEVSRLHCKEAAKAHSDSNVLCTESERVRQVAQGLRKKKK